MAGCRPAQWKRKEKKEKQELGAIPSSEESSKELVVVVVVVCWTAWKCDGGPTAEQVWVADATFCGSRGPSLCPFFHRPHHRAACRLDDGSSAQRKKHQALKYRPQTRPLPPSLSLSLARGACVCVCLFSALLCMCCGAAREFDRFVCEELVGSRSSRGSDLWGRR